MLDFYDLFWWSICAFPCWNFLKTSQFRTVPGGIVQNWLLLHIFLTRNAQPCLILFMKPDRYHIGWVLSVLVFFAGTGTPAFADIYKYVDENGIIHFTNAPTSSDYQVYVRDNFFKNNHSPRMPDKYDAYIRAAASKYNVSFPLIKAIIQAESSFNPRAVSRAGALGLMQLMPENVRLLNIRDPFDPWENIMGGTRFFKNLLNRFDGKLSLALAGYNAGPHRVDQYNGIPPFRETQDYVRKVLRYYRMLKAR